MGGKNTNTNIYLYEEPEKIRTSFMFSFVIWKDSFIKDRKTPYKYREIYYFIKYAEPKKIRKINYLQEDIESISRAIKNRIVEVEEVQKKN